MSWCRWGSPCSATFPVRYKVDAACKDCPGSSLYIYESVDGGIVCCACSLSTDGESDFTAADDGSMLAHIREHDAVGHHVRRSLLEASPEMTEESAALMRAFRGEDDDEVSPQRQDERSK